MDDIQGSCQSAVDILNDLLVYERLSEDRVEVLTKSIHLIPLLKKKIDSMLPLARQKGITLDLILPQGPLIDRQFDLRQVCIEGEEDKLGQVIRNLVSNAIECTPNNDIVTVTVDVINTTTTNTTGTINSHSRCPYRVRISVKDHGPGLTKEHQEMVFEEALKFTAGVLQTREGKGLGLWSELLLLQL
eukprot:gene35739-46370_t